MERQAGMRRGQQFCSTCQDDQYAVKDQEQKLAIIFLSECLLNVQQYYRMTPDAHVRLCIALSLQHAATDSHHPVLRAAALQHVDARATRAVPSA